MSPLKIAFLTTFIDLLGFGVVIPIQPFYAQNFGASPTTITLLGASYSLMQFLFSGVIGRLSDRHGRRPTLLSCVSLIALGYYLFATAESVTGLFVARMISGLGGANLGAAQAIIADVTPPHERAKGMGLIGAAFGLGFIFGPAMGGLLGQHHPTTPIFAAGGLALLNLALIARFLPETRVPREHEGPPESASALRAEVLRAPHTLALLALALTFTLAFAMMEQTIGLYIERVWVAPLGLGAAAQTKEASALTAYFLVAVGVAATVVQGGLIGRLSRRFGEARLCKVGVGVVALSFALIPVAGRAGSYGALLGLALLMATGTGVLHPSRNSLLSRGVAPHLQGHALGLSHSAAALGRVLGPAMAGALFERHLELPLWAGVGLLALTVGFALTLRDAPRAAAA